MKRMICQKTPYQQSHNSGLWAKILTMSFIWIFMMKIFRNIFPEKLNSTPFKLLVFLNRFSKVFQFFTKLEQFTGILSLQTSWFRLKMMGRLKPNSSTLASQPMFHLTLKVPKFWDFLLNTLLLNVLTHVKRVLIPKRLTYGQLVSLFTSSRQIECQLLIQSVLKMTFVINGLLLLTFLFLNTEKVVGQLSRTCF